MLIAVALLSAAVLAYEIALLRLLQYASWHHFAFVVISLALLGFGASGTALSLLRSRLMRRANTAMHGLAIITAVSMPLCWQLAQQIEVEVRLTPATIWRQVADWSLYWMILSAPFFFGASAIGLALMVAGERVSKVYAANLLGSGVGAVGVTGLMWLVAPIWLTPLTGAVALLAALCVPVRRRLIAPLSVLVIASTWLWFAPPGIRVDPSKYAGFVSDLVHQGSARRVARAVSPRAVVEMYAGDAFHDVPFLSGGEAPPPMIVMLSDGHRAGSVLRVDDVSDAVVMDHTMMAVPYELAPPRPHVALLGERGGTNVWLALRRGARTVDMVQPDPRLFELLRGPLHATGGAVLDQPGVSAHAAEPRSFIDRAHGGLYDVIQLVDLEALAAGSGGLGGLGQDSLTTVEGIGACLRRLSPVGLLFACRGIQTPPRDGVKLITLLDAALRRRGVTDPGRHVVIVRDFLAVCVIVRVTAWSPQQIQQVRSLCDERSLTPVWYNGIRDEELNRPDVLPGPPDTPGDWYTHAAQEVFAGRRDGLIADWPFDVRPPTDDRPFFADFCKLSSMHRLRAAFGPMWLTRIEMALPLVILTAIVGGIAGLLLTIGPLLLIKEVRRQRMKAATSIYFLAIGLGYLMLEMTALSRLMFLIGDPVRAAALTIGAFLVLSGLGSALAPRSGAKLRWVVAGIVLTAIAAELVWPLMRSVPEAVRAAGSLLIVAPAAILMGIPMPTGLRRLNRCAPALTPWAWGVNGFASVVAAPLATAIGMSSGYRAAGIAALLMYVIATATINRLPHCRSSV